MPPDEIDDACESAACRDKLKAWFDLLKIGVAPEQALIRLGVKVLDDVIKISGYNELKMNDDDDGKLSIVEESGEQPTAEVSENKPRAAEESAEELPAVEGAKDKPSTADEQEAKSSIEEPETVSSAEEERELEAVSCALIADILSKVKLLQGEGSAVECLSPERGEVRADPEKENEENELQEAAQLAEVSNEEDGNEVGEAQAPIDDEEAAEQCKEEEKNTLEDLIDWLLFEAEYCAHGMLMASGRVIVDSNGQPDKTFLWGRSGHRCLTEANNPIYAALHRLKTALRSLKILLDCPSVRSLGWIWNERYSIIRCMISFVASDNGLDDDDLFISNVDGGGDEMTPIQIKPFYEIAARQYSNADMYLVQNGLPGYIEAMNRLLDKTTGLHWDLKILSALNEASNMICDYKQVRFMIEPLAASKKITDIRVGKSYLKLFRTAYGNLAFADKKRVMQDFYNKYGPAVTWHESDEEFGTNLALAMNKLHGQHSSRKLDKIAAEYCWFFMLSLKFTWWKLLTTILRTPEIIPNVVEILRRIEPVNTLRVNANAADHRQVLVGIRRLLEDGHVKDDRQEEIWIQLVGTLLSEKTVCSMNSGGGYTSSLRPPVIDVLEGVSTLIIPVMRSHPRPAIVCLVPLLESGSITWSQDTPALEESGNLGGCMNSAQLIITIVETFVHFNRQNTGLPKLCLELLHLLSEIWDLTGQKLPAATTKWIGKKVESLHWAEQHFIKEYFPDLIVENAKVGLW